MASLFNTKISNTYVGLLKTVDNAVIGATLKELTDGLGNQSGLYLNTSGDFKATGILEWGSLKDTGESITITKFVDEADGIASNDNDTTIPTSAAIVDYVAARITLEDLDFSGTTGTGSVDLDSQVFAITGTANQIETTASSQSLTLAFPSAGIVLPDGSTATTQSAGDNSTKVATTAYVETAVDTVDTLAEILAIGNTTGVTKISVDNTSSGIDLIDDAKIRLGTGNDFEIYHDGSNSYIKDVGTGNLEIQASAIILKDTSSNTLGTFYSGGKNEFYFNSSKKLETTSDGATVTGGLTATGSSVFTAASFSGTITGDLTGDVTGNVTATSVLADGVTATTQSSSNNSTKVATTAYVDTQAGLSDTLSEVLAIGNTTGATKISVDNTSGGIDFIDNAKVRFGTGNDLEIYHDASDSFIKDGGVGDLLIQADDLIIKSSGGTETKATFETNGAVALYYDDASKIQTTNTGINVTGGITTNAASTFSSSLDVTGAITADGGLNLNDNDKIKLGTSQDLEIYHDGSNSIIEDTGTGDLHIIGDNDIVFKDGSGNILANMNAINSVELNFAGTNKFATTNTGVDITGVANVSSEVFVGTANSVFGENLLRFKSAGTGYFDHNTTSQSFIFRTSNSSSLDTTALTISANGDLSTGRDVTIAGDLTVNGTTTTVNTEHFNVEDPLISMSKDNAANSVDIGFYGKYNDGTARYLGLFSDASDANRFKLFKGLTAEPTTTVDTSGTGYEYADILLASLESRGNLTIKQQDDSGFDGGLIITRSANTQKLVIGMDGGAVNFNSPDSLTYKFRANGTEKASIDGSGNTTFAGDLTVQGGDILNSSGHFTITSADDFNVDAAGQINLDADGGNIRFKDAGTEIGALDLTGGLALKSSVSDADFFIQGNDGGSIINALQIDMSNGGSATFNNDVTITGTTYVNNVQARTSAGLKVGNDDFSGFVQVADNGQVNFDSGNSEIHFLGSGTTFGKIFKSSDNFYINNPIQDKDIIFSGNDGGSSVTALTLDMSNGGSATFSDDIDYGGKLTQTGTGANTFAGSVGIGVAPEELLHLKSDNPKVYLEDGNAGTNEKVYSIYPAGSQYVLQTLADDYGAGQQIYVVDRNGTTVDGQKWYINNSEALVLDSSGYVGIGITDPDSYYGKQLVVAAADESGITIMGTASNQKQYLCFASNSTGANAYAGYMAYDHNTNALSFATNGGSNALTLDSSQNATFTGNVTISNSSNSFLRLQKVINESALPDVPDEHVISLYPPTTTDYYGGGISWSEGSNTAASIGVYDAGSGGALGMYLATGNNTTLTKALTIDNSQNATFAGNVTLEQDTSTVYDSTANQTGGLWVNNIYHEALNTFSQIRLGVSGASGASSARIVGIETGQAQSDLAFVLRDGSGYNEVVRLKGSNQNVGIGNTSATYRLTVTHDVANYIAAFQNSDASTGYGVLIDSTDGTTGYIAAGFRTAGGVYKCQILGNGDIVNVNNSYGTLSDIKLKENIKDATPKLDDLCKLQVRNFDLKSTGEKQIGFVAQEMEKVFPTLVYETDDTQDTEDGTIEKTGEKTKAIKTSVLVPMLVKAVQELKAEVDELKKNCNCQK